MDRYKSADENPFIWSWCNKDLRSRFHYFHMSRPRHADEHVCVGPLAQ